MKIGYARVNTNGVHQFDLQHEELRRAGCDAIFEEVASGNSSDRPVLSRLLSSLQPGDTLVVCQVNRISRSLPFVLETLAKLKKSGIGFYTVPPRE